MAAARVPLGAAAAAVTLLGGEGGKREKKKKKKLREKRGGKEAAAELLSQRAAACQRHSPRGRDAHRAARRTRTHGSTADRDRWVPSRAEPSRAGPSCAVPGRSRGRRRGGGGPGRELLPAAALALPGGVRGRDRVPRGYQGFWGVPPGTGPGKAPVCPMPQAGTQVHPAACAGEQGPTGQVAGVPLFSHPVFSRVPGPPGPAWCGLQSAASLWHTSVGLPAAGVSQPAPSGLCLPSSASLRWSVHLRQSQRTF